MGGPKIFISLLSLWWGFTGLQAQKSYALIVGINDYYEQPGIKSEISLHGSVNDARSIRDLLIKKFGVSPRRIDTLYNGDATRDNIVAGLKKKLDQCQPGDQMFFYYSGHGVYLRNGMEDNDPVKRGYSQAMLTSDLYNFKDHFKCFLRDNTLKTYFNLFIDKKVVLTSLFDCCFSGNLIQAGHDTSQIRVRPKTINFFSLMDRLTEQAANTQRLLDSIAGRSAEGVSGCKVDARGRLTDSLDSDGDGVPDCRDRERFTPPDCLPSDSNGVGNCPFDYLLDQTLSQYDSTESKRQPPGRRGMIAARNFDAAFVPTISEKDSIMRPANRKNSRILFMSASTYVQKALEFTEKGQPEHGFFTASLLRVMDSLPPTCSAQLLFDSIVADMARYHLNQTPTLLSDPDRLGASLLGNPQPKKAAK